MPEENKLADIVSSREGDDPFKDVKDEEEKDTSQDSPSEEKTKEEKSPSSQGEPEDKTEGETEGEPEDKTEGEPKEEPKEESKKDSTEEEKQIPFHKHPRWIEREKQWNERFETLKQEGQEELETALEKLKPQEPKGIPNWFKGLYGEDQPEMWNEYNAERKADRDALKQEILVEQREEQSERISKQNEEVQYWNEWIDTEVDKLKADGKSFNRNELLKVALEFKPTDEQGNIDLEKSYELMERMKAKDTKKSKARKELADSTISDTRGEESPKDFRTPKDLKGRSWEDII